MITLNLISEEEFQRGLKIWVKEYAEDKVKAGTWKEEVAFELSTNEFAKLLPKGRNSVDQHVLSIRDEENNRNIGVIWFGVYRNTEPFGAFIWDFRIDDKYRGKGYGRQTVEALDRKLREMGIGNVALHVFGHNEVAISLYKKMGFVVTDLMMAKKLD